VPNFPFLNPIRFSESRSVTVERLLTRGDLADLYVGTMEGIAPVRVARTRYDRIIEDEGPTVVVKIATRAADNDLLERECFTLEKIVPEGTADEKFYRYFPRCLLAGNVTGLAANVFPYAAGYVSLADVLRAYPGGLDFRDVVWMFKRTLAGLGFAHRRGFVHGAILPEHVLIHPTNHGAKLVDWCYAVPTGRRGVAYVASRRDYYAPEVLQKVGLGPSTDIFMAASCAVALLGGNPATGEMPDAVPGPVRDFLTTCRSLEFAPRPQDAWDAHEAFDKVLFDLVGKPAYRPLTMPAVTLGFLWALPVRSVAMIKPSEVGWGKYGGFEGPHYRGSIPYVEPSNPTWEDKLVSTVTATEGGRLDGYNGYDRMIVSVGVIQWGEAGQYSVSDLLGAVSKADPFGLSKALAPALSASDAVFKPNARGRWRFHFRDGRGEVDRVEEQRQLFLLHSDGHVGTWDDASRAHAKLWASCLVNVWQSKEACEAQIAYTAPKMMGFLMPAARTTLFGPGTPAENEGWPGALRAGYISFAANLPAVAAKMLAKAVATTNEAPWSPSWCIAILRELTFGPGIAIYPHRYEKIRPVLERLFGVDLPDFAADLQAWEEAMGEAPGAPVDTTVDVQRALLRLGYDLGPAGSDGIMGRLTREAIVQFQTQAGLEPDGVIGKKTRTALARAAA
jgi:Putative peptidoglycan binding domain/Protein kinase domain